MTLLPLLPLLPLLLRLTIYVTPGQWTVNVTQTVGKAKRLRAMQGVFVKMGCRCSVSTVCFWMMRSRYENDDEGSCGAAHSIRTRKVILERLRLMWSHL